MPQQDGHEAQIYIGPAALCPCPETDGPYLVITGDQEPWALQLIQEKTKKRKSQNIAIRQNTIGKPGTTKEWFTYSQRSLNGTNNIGVINWANPTWNIRTNGSKRVNNEKLETILEETNLSQHYFHLSVAQGDPHLTLKRNKKALQNCLSVDLSLHPFALVWAKSISIYLKEQGFSNEAEQKLLWIKPTTSRHEQQPQIKPLAEPSESEKFLHPTVRTLCQFINPENYRSGGYVGSDLSLIRQVALGEITHSNEGSIRDIVKIRANKWLQRIISLSKARTKETINSKQLAQSNKWTDADECKEQVRKKLRGHIDGFQETMALHGWADGSDFGDGPSSLSVVWVEQDQVIGEGRANLERTDLLTTGIENINCGFSIDLKLFQTLTLNEILDTPISLRVIESKSQKSISKEPWRLDQQRKRNIIQALVSEQLTATRKEQIFTYLETSRNPIYTTAIRARFLEITALQCMTNQWGDFPLIEVIKRQNKNPALNYGVQQESASRIELVLMAWIKLIERLDTEKIHNHESFNEQSKGNGPYEDLEELSANIKQCSFIGLQKWEKDCWDEFIRPLYDVLIGTIFLQQKNHQLEESVQKLMDVLASTIQSVYGAPQLAFHLRSIIKAQQETSFDEAFTKLAHQRGDRFTFLLSYYSENLKSNTFGKDFLYYAAAIDFASSNPAIHRQLTKKFQDLLPGYLAQHPRQSKPKHWVERLGLMSSNSAQKLVNKMLNLGFAQERVADLHLEMIETKQRLADLLWNHSEALDSEADQNKKSGDRKKWLIIGEKNLSQCWMYRVEQKKHFLEKLGCEVRCIDQEELRHWSFTHDILWADAVIFCRLAAMYPVFRAISFAKKCGLKTYAEIDDLIFTSDYPAKFESYGGTIPIEQYRNLCIDYPLRREVLNAVDEIIVSTKVLADTCKNILKDENKTIHILPNLPLAELEQIEKLPITENLNLDEGREIKIALTSGTLSHKQILKEDIYPVLLEVLENHSNLKLLVVGHIDLPSAFQKYASQITSVPFTSYSDYLALLKKASIALVPLEVHPTTHAKSAIKWMEASLCGVACICSPVRAYTDVTTEGEDVLLASSLNEWKQNLEDLINHPERRQTIARQAYESAKRQFNREIGENIWRELIKAENRLSSEKVKKKILVINVFFAPQSVGGATRVAQDYVERMLSDQDIDYDVTVLCTDYDRWQADIGNNKRNIEQDADSEPSSLSQSGAAKRAGRDINHQDHQYRDSLTIDRSNWRGAKVIRLNLPAKPWAIHEDEDIEAFCTELFQNEQFDLIQCHCCQILTAAPLAAAMKLGVPYEIIMHDAWWMSEEQFLVSPAGRLIDPADPLDHFDDEPNESEKTDALTRRQKLYQILENAQRRVAVSAAFKRVCEVAGIQDVSVQENTFTPMASGEDKKRKSRSENEPIKICHIGGMSLHKGYQLFRQAVQALPQGLGLEFTVIDHRLAAASDEYTTHWNSYNIRFIAPIAMEEMSQFYSSQDVLVAPSIWPESFGLVTREALSAGLWVIASDSGALAEPLIQSESPHGTVLRPNNLPDLVKALIECPSQLRENV